MAARLMMSVVLYGLFTVACAEQIGFIPSGLDTVMLTTMLTHIHLPHLPAVLLLGSTPCCETTLSDRAHNMLYSSVH